MENNFQAYIRDLVGLLREAAGDAQECSRNEGTGQGFQAGRALAYAEVLSLMQSQADSFMIDRQSLGLHGFDPLNELWTAGRER